ncbi:DUF2971 domain-containing protein [Curvibacter lanceolatus]|uniref:DUF2971 domain-containing protein n=1 Tax=Curvibacter lanceolatus TaxID=86182 RepID=UPI002354DCE8|nr:DUF2971 domain-containing protein [Curvibacter lanceolatus]
MTNTHSTSTKARYFYKYRAFSPNTIQSLVADEIYFADPSSFNDPLDTKPCVEADLANDELQEVLRQLIEQKEVAIMRSAARSIGYRGPNTTSRIEDRSRRRAKAMIDELKYQATNPDWTGTEEEALRFYLTNAIEVQLLQRYAKGIYCLGTRSSCPLMWSHYGDQHRGLCIGYTVPERELTNLFKVEYRGSRLVQTSDVAAMLAGDSAAARTVDSAVLLKKAADWRYEREWRLFGERGRQSSPLELNSITFGMRCASTVQYAVVQALAEREREVKFYEMVEQRGSFALKRQKLDIDALSSGYPARALSLSEAFEDLNEGSWQ